MLAADSSNVDVRWLPIRLHGITVNARGPPGVSDNSFHPSCLIYSFLSQMTFGRLDLQLNYPEKQASYQVSIRHNRCLPPASFIPNKVGDQSPETPLPSAIRFPSLRFFRDLRPFASHPLDLSHARHTDLSSAKRTFVYTNIYIASHLELDVLKNEEVTKWIQSKIYK